MATTISDLELMAESLSFEDRLRLLEHVARSLRRSEGARAPARLWGIWGERYSEEFDVDAALSEIRSHWVIARLS